MRASPVSFIRRPATRGVVVAMAMALTICTGCTVICALMGVPPEDCTLPGGLGGQTAMVQIEVRFLGVEDEFFERIGVDFDFNFDEQATFTNGEMTHGVPDNQPGGAGLVPSNETGGQDNTQMFVPDAITNMTYFLPTVPDGAAAQPINYFPGTFADLQIPFNQPVAVPNFGGFTGSAVLGTNLPNPDAASVGFAILSDIEAFVFLQAAQADTRNGILTAPKVTLFNGQPTTVIAANENTLIADVEQSFADAAKGLNPAVSTVTSGPTLMFEAVISADRRFVQLQISPIRAIQFAADRNAVADRVNSSILLPVIQHSSVQTTVSVPDGGTILLGGIKRLSDGGDERGVPILNKLPYINRLFRNTGTIKDTQSLMLMVTPRIIIQ